MCRWIRCKCFTLCVLYFLETSSATRRTRRYADFRNDLADMGNRKKNSFQNRIPVLQHAVIHRITEIYRYYAQLNINVKLFMNLTSTGPCIVIYFYSKTNYTHECITFILFWNDTLHVSDGLSVHHQEFKTVHTATGICQTDTAVCSLAGTRWNKFHLVPTNKQTAVSVWHMPVAVCTVLNSWCWTERLSEKCTVSFQNKINLIHWRI